ncbi:hypothetical protein Stsp01_00370 [Streptomyces sp. NBRC 13847]|nr:hypothetical protein Stsp01_00370 [Streptomyces sp. NBRC 13847]
MVESQKNPRNGRGDRHRARGRFVEPGVNPPPQQAPQPSAPRRRPYGSVRLPAPLPVAPPTPHSGPPAVARRWYGPRVTLPLLSIAALRRDA